MESEIWKDIEGYDGYYQVSNTGKVKSLRRTIQRVDGRTTTIKEKILRNRKGTNGYDGIQLSVEGIVKPKEIHRLVAYHFIDNPQNKREVNHKDGNKKNNNDWNLEWQTPKENQHHARTTGLINDAGENNSRAVLTNQQAREIRALAGTMSQRKIGSIYGIGQAHVSNIILNKSYKNV